MSTTAAPPEQSTTPVDPTGIPRGLAALIGLLAVGAALAAGHLVAALFAPGSSPFFAVADTVIRLSPSWLTEFGKSLGPVLDKLLLQVGVGVALVVAGLVAGLVSRRRVAPGLVVIAVLGLLGLAAVVFGPAFGPIDLTAPLASLVVGLPVFALLHRLALPRTDPAAPGGPGVTRRGVLIGTSVAVGAGAVAAAGGGVLLGGLGDSRAQVTARLARVPLTERASVIPAGASFPDLSTPTFITPDPEFYRIDVALQIPSQRASDWSMRIHGMVDNEIDLTFDDLLARPLVERTNTMTCVSNPVGGNLISTGNFIGVDLRELLMEAGVQPGADQIFTTSIDGWYTGTPTDVVMEPGRGAMLVVGMNGEALSPERGFPVRMMVPGLYGFVSGTKWLADMELTTFDARQGYWLERGWAQKAPIKTQSRIDQPRGFSTNPAGRTTIAGIAWSQPTGISKVEVRMDGGAWVEAELSDEVNTRTWRMWRTDFDLAPGNHTVQTRATDKNGVTQTEVRADPIPDGASAWPATIFTVA